MAADPYTPDMFGFERFEDCPEAHLHPNMPSGYVERSEWSERQLKRYTPARCRSCGFWVLWRRRPVGRG